MKPLETFIKSEAGAITVDWVVLTAAAAFIGLAVLTIVSGGVEDLSGEIQQELLAQDASTNPFDRDPVEGSPNLLDED